MHLFQINCNPEASQAAWPQPLAPAGHALRTMRLSGISGRARGMPLCGGQLFSRESVWGWAAAARVLLSPGCQDVLLNQDVKQQLEEDLPLLPRLA